MKISEGRWNGPIWDTHIHLDLEARGLSAAQDFANAGGTHICLVHKPSFSSGLPITIEQVDEAYQQTINLANQVRQNVGLDVRVILGPHPVVWEKQIHTLGMEASTQLHFDSVELALNYCAEGLAVGLGEIGRPHYPVSKEIWSAANTQLETVMRMASKANVPIQLHVEDNGATTNAELAIICDRAGLNRNDAVHHYASPDVSGQFTSGLSSSVSMGKHSVTKLLTTFTECTTSWTMETDYLDDPNRPGAVLGPKTVPKRTQQMVGELLKIVSKSEAEELLMHVHSIWPSQLYGQIDP